MRTAEFDYELPLELIAQTPALARDRSRLLVLHRSDGRIAHRSFRDLPEYLRAGKIRATLGEREIETAHAQAADRLTVTFPATLELAANQRLELTISS